jgi:hypothetical protein
MTPTKPTAPRLTHKVEIGLLRLSEAAGSIQDPDGAVATARRWIAERLALRSEAAISAMPAKDVTHQEVIDALVQAWEAEHGCKYPFSTRDARAVTAMRALPDFEPETALRRWSALLSDPWWRRRGIAIPDLVTQWTRLASRTVSHSGLASGATSAAARLARKLKGSQ